MLDRRTLLLAAPAAAVLARAGAVRAADEAWETVRHALFQDRPILDGSALLALEAPYRAYDAAVVPVSVRALAPQTEGQRIQRLYLVVDKNPAPVAAVFEFASEVPRADVATRIRINEYTDIHAVAETADGSLLAVSRFVKAAGGCSAPATKDKAAAMARMGLMKLKAGPVTASSGARTIELLIGHPQSTGMQMDQLTRNWIPPDYIRRIAVTLDGRRLLDIQSDISISEDPQITFTVDPAARGELRVVVVDSEERSFEHSWTLGDAS